MSGKITDFFSKVKKDGAEEEKEEEKVVVEKKKPVEKKKKVVVEKKKVEKTTKKRKQIESSDDDDDNDDETENEENNGKKLKVDNDKTTTTTTTSDNDEKLKQGDEEKEKEEEENKIIVSENNYYDDIESYFTDKNWREALKDEFKKPYFKNMIKQLNQCYSKNEKPIYPPKDEIFSAFNYSHLKDVKVVIVGQDPYHGSGQAHGLSFSVKKGVPPPPSLINIYKELETDIKGFKRPMKNGFLEPWAKQGVFLLNAALTVEEATPNSHKDYGWYEFTDAVLKILSKQEQPIVFILWGGFAKKKEKLFDKKKHCVLTSGHPSPLSIKFFTGCKHFSKTNEYLNSKNVKEIDWTITE